MNSKKPNYFCFKFYVIKIKCNEILIYILRFINMNIRPSVHKPYKAYLENPNPKDEL